MNGETLLAIKITVAANQVLQGKKPIGVYERYIASVGFVFDDGTKTIRTSDSWYRYLKENGVLSVKYIANTADVQLPYAGFSNARKDMILCIRKDGIASVFRPVWEFSKTAQRWDVVCTEYPCEEPDKAAYMYANPKEEFINTLKDIENLADTLGEKFFADIFGKCLNVLTGKKKLDKKEENYALTDAWGDEEKRLWYAATSADVFGGMDSWNDDPRGIAEELSLSDEYKRCSENLYVVMHKTLMYLCNACPA